MNRTSIVPATAFVLPALAALCASFASPSPIQPAGASVPAGANVSATGASATPTPDANATASSPSAAPSLVTRAMKFFVDNIGVFELDGDMIDEAGAPCSVNAGIDWNTVDFNAGNAVAVCDPIGTNVDPIFTGGGSKDILDLDQWACTLGSVPDKDDLLRGGALAATVPLDNCGSLHNSPGDKLLYFFADRYANNGDAQLGFWFFQNRVVRNPATCLFEDGNGNPAQHRDGDLLILAHFTNGGAVTDPLVLKWQAGAPNNLVDVTPQPFICGLNPDPEVCLVANPDNSPTCQNTEAIVLNSDTCTNNTYTPKFPGNCPRTGFYPNVSFFEGGINLTVLVPDVCCFTSFLIETRSSQSLDAVLKDFLLGQIDTCDLDISQTCSNGCVGGTGVTFSGTVTNSGFETLNNVVVHNTACGNVNIGSLAAGASAPWSCTATCSSAGSISNTTFATGDPVGTCGSSVTSESETDSCDCGSASLALTQSCTNGCVQGGTGVTFSGTVTNTGSVNLTGVVVTNSACGNVNIGNLAAGASAPWSCTAACSTGGTITNNAQASGNAGAPCNTTVSSNTESDSCVCQTASLALTQSCTNGCVQGGTGVTFSGTVTNTGTVALTGVVVNNSACGNVNVGSLAAGASAPWSCTATCSTGGTITNNAQATGNAGAPCNTAVSSNTESDSCICQTASIALSQICSNGCVQGGTGITFSGTVTNTGSVALTGVVVTNTACGNVNIGNLAAGASAPWSCTAACSTGGTISNTATASGNAGAPCNTSVNSGGETDTCTCQTATLTLTQSCADSCGSGITFSGTVTNTGTVTITGIVVTNSACGNVNVGTLAAGASAPWSCVAACQTSGPITNTATASGTAGAPCNTTVSSNTEVDTCICQTASLQLTQSCTNGCVQGGTGVTFSGTVTNPGSVAVTNVVVVNTACGNVNIGTLAAGASAPWSCTATCSTGGTITNTAQATGTAGPPCNTTVSSNADTKTCTCNTTSLSLTQSCTNGCVQGGTGVTFSGTVTNTGTVTVTGIVVTNTACGNVNVGTLAAGASAPWSCTATCSTGGTITNSAQASGTAGAPCNTAVSSNTATNTCTCNTTSLSITQSCTNGCSGGTGITFSGTVTNTGTVTVTGIVVTNTACGNVNVGTLAAGASAPWSCTADCTTGGDISNTAQASGTAGAPCNTAVSSNAATNTCTCNVTCLSITETCTPPSPCGAPITFSGTVTNCGTVTIDNVVVTGSLCSPAAIGSLAPGASASWSCTFNSAPGSYTNTVTATGDAGLPCSGTVTSNTGTATCTIVGCGEGCTPGYWRNHQSRWDSPSDPIAAAAGFTTSTDFYAFFGLTPGVCGLPTTLTMGQAITLGGGGPFKLARHGIAGLLNYAAGLAYTIPGSNIRNAAQLRQAMIDAYNSCTFEPLATQIAAGNETGTCPLN